MESQKDIPQLWPFLSYSEYEHNLKRCPILIKSCSEWALFSWAYVNDRTHFNLMDLITKNYLERLEKPDFLSLASQNQTVDLKKENPLMLLHDFYYGQQKETGSQNRRLTQLSNASAVWKF